MVPFPVIVRTALSPGLPDTVMAAVLPLPTTVGLKTTVTSHVSVASNICPVHPSTVTRKSPASVPESTAIRTPVVGVDAAFRKVTVIEVEALAGLTEVGARAKDFEPSEAVARDPPPELVAESTLSAASALPVRVAVGGVAVVPGDALTVKVPVLVAGVKAMGVNWMLTVQVVFVSSVPMVRQLLVADGEESGTTVKSGTTLPALSTTVNPSRPLFCELTPFVTTNWNGFVAPVAVDNTG